MIRTLAATIPNTGALALIYVAVVVRLRRYRQTSIFLHAGRRTTPVGLCVRNAGVGAVTKRQTQSIFPAGCFVLAAREVFVLRAV